MRQHAVWSLAEQPACRLATRLVGCFNKTFLNSLLTSFFFLNFFFILRHLSFRLCLVSNELWRLLYIFYHKILPAQVSSKWSIQIVPLTKTTFIKKKKKTRKQIQISFSKVIPLNWCSVFKNPCGDIMNVFAWWLMRLILWSRLLCGQAQSAWLTETSNQINRLWMDGSLNSHSLIKTTSHILEPDTHPHCKCT